VEQEWEEEMYEGVQVKHRSCLVVVACSVEVARSLVLYPPSQVWELSRWLEED